MALQNFGISCLSWRQTYKRLGGSLALPESRKAIQEEIAFKSLAPSTTPSPVQGSHPGPAE
jgi:hypothetical protein